MDNEQRIEGAFVAARQRLDRCRVALNRYAEADEFSPAEIRDEELGDIAESIEYETNHCKLSVSFLLELLGLKRQSKSFELKFKAVANSVSNVKYFDEYVGPSTDAYDLLYQYISSLKPMFASNSKMDGGRSVLTNILQQASYYIRETNQLPKTEPQLQKAMLVPLKMAFPDVIRDPHQPKQTKNYKPDFGIESIDASIEFKFISDSNKASSALGELYEDMKGYKCHSRHMCYGLIYMTEPFLSQATVDAELKTVDAAANWKVFVVTGSAMQAA